MMKLYKYHGAGNDFLLYDAREDRKTFLSDQVVALCDRHTGIGSDGLMVLSDAAGYDFKMDFYNPDGSSGMMCGNGGRCIVAFARDLGIAPAANGRYSFLAPDGPHAACLISEEGMIKSVRLGMKDVVDYRMVVCDPISGWFVDTGTRHFVTFVPTVKKVDVEMLGRKIRHSPEFGPEGVNVNFVEYIGPGEIAVRTFEKGVEGETLACGTGITAAAIATWLTRKTHAHVNPGPEGGSFLVHACRHDLTVSFTPPGDQDITFTGVSLTGPAEKVAEILL